MRIDGKRWVMVAALWIPLMFTLVLAFLAQQGQHSRDLASLWVLHTVEVKDQLEQLKSLVEDVETSQRGYLLTGNASFLTLNEQARNAIPGQNQRLALLIVDNPRQVAAAEHLRTLIAGKLAIVARSLLLAQQGKLSDAIQIVKNGKGQELMGEIRPQVSAMEAEENRLLAARQNVLASEVEAQKSLMIGLISVEVAVIVGATLLMQRLRTSRQKADVRIVEANTRTDQEQVRTEEANIRTEQAEATTSLLHTCVSSLSDIVLITEADSMEEPGPRIVFVNKAFERMTGYTSAEALGRSPRFLQGEKTDRGILAEIHQAVAQRKPIRRQIINYRKDGTEFWLDIDIVPIFDAEGKCTHFAGIERDITTEKKIEERLRWQTAFFEAQVYSDLDGINVVDREGKKILQNQRMVDLWNIPQRIADDVDDRRQLDWVASQVKNPGKFAKRAGYLYAHPDEVSHDELELIDGRFFDRYSAPVRDRDGYYYGRIWSYHDFTERHRAEEALRESNAKFRILFDVANDAINIIQNGVYVDCNAKTPELFGATRDQVIGQSPSFFSPPTQPDGSNSQEKAAEFIRRALAGQPQSFEWLHQRSDGTLVSADVSLSRFELGGELFIQSIVRDITERKQTEEKLRRQQTELRVLFDLMPAMVWFKDTENRILRVNERVAQAIGKSVEEMEGKPSLEFYPREAAKFYADDLEVIRSGLPKLGIVEKIRGREGEEFWVRTDKVPYRDRNGKVIGIVVMAQDITGRKQAEEAQRAGEERYRALFDYAPDGLVITDSRSCYIDANPSICRMLGYTRNELIGLHARDIVAPPEIEHIEPALGAIEARSDHKQEWQLRRKDGSLFGAEVIVAKMPDGNLMAMIRDITERKRTEARFRRLVDSNAQAVVFWNTKGEITGGNNAFSLLVGYSQEDFNAGRARWASMTPPEYAGLDRHSLEEIAARGVCAPYEKEFIRKDGSRVPILIGAATFEDNPEEGVSFVLDLTERKKLEQQIFRAQRVESIGTLANGIAHDLNNILAPIMMSIDILKLTVTDPQATEILETIELSSERGADLVRQILSFSRGLGSGQIEVQPKHLLKDIENLVKNTFPKDIRLRFSSPDDTWTIVGDPTQVHQILLNLCVNARDAMPNGGTLTISVENRVLDEHYAAMNLQGKAGRYVKIAVTDSGTGIPPAILAKIFDPFFTTKELNKGTGLGLSTVMSIVKSHKGIINVSSDPGKGTTFEIHLPATEMSAEEQREQPEVSLPFGNGETVLVIDDEASILSITSETLQAFGYRVLTATDGVNAMAIFTEHKHEIAVVLTDMMMPVMAGPATIRALRRINPAIKVVGASGLDADEAATAGGGIDLRHFLTKPYTAATLLTTIRAILDEV